LDVTQIKFISFSLKPVVLAEFLISVSGTPFHLLIKIQVSGGIPHLFKTLQGLSIVCGIKINIL
jgi:hypothetical protein